MKDEGQVAVKFDLMYIFMIKKNVYLTKEKRLLPTLAETRWTSLTDTINLAVETL